MKGDAIAAAIWEAVKGHEFVWRIGPTARIRLAAIAPDATALPEDAALANVHVREILAPILRAADEARRFDACCWIVREWGGIRSNKRERLETYARALGDGGRPAADAFAADAGARGVSSWSKVLAFAHPEHHAVYDARTSVALNLLLREAGDARRFWMPMTQNREVAAARRALLADRPNGAPLGYGAYLDMLRGIVEAGAASMLTAEMALFASAPTLASRRAGAPGRHAG